MKKAALLCNGPSRTLWQGRDGYDYVMGCNIPWTEVDTTVVLDVNVLQKWKDPCPFFASVNAWRECTHRQGLIDLFLGFINVMQEYDTAGHAACRKLIENRFDQIDIYGCDSWWVNNTESYTHQFVDGRSIDMNRHVSVWRQRWYELMGSHPETKFNFIGAPNET